MTNITPTRAKEFMARTLVGMVLYNKREFTDEECEVYNFILARLDEKYLSTNVEDITQAEPERSAPPANESEEVIRLKLRINKLESWLEDALFDAPAPPEPVKVTREWVIKKLKKLMVEDDPVGAWQSRTTVKGDYPYLLSLDDVLGLFREKGIVVGAEPGEKEGEGK